MTITEEEFTKAYKEHYGRLLTKATNALSDPDEAADVIQDIFKALLRQKDYSKLQANLAAWLTTCCQYRCATSLRLAKTRARRDNAFKQELDIFAEEPDPFEYACVQERNAALRETMTELSAAQASGLDMYYFKYMTYETISTQTGKSITSISTMLERARRKMKMKLGKQIHEL
jgi:RNA polymerase sigma-70 factor (ECF subfamily)